MCPIRGAGRIGAMILAAFTLAAVFALVYAMRTDPNGPIATWAFRAVVAGSAMGLLIAITA